MSQLKDDSVDLRITRVPNIALLSRPDVFP